MLKYFLFFCSCLILAGGCDSSDSSSPPKPFQNQKSLPSLEELSNNDLSIKPRIVVLTDFGADPDDEQSMVRFLLYANEFDIEGLLVTSTGFDGDERKLQNDLLIKYLDGYDAVQTNLPNHAEGYPSAKELKALVKPDKWMRHKAASHHHWLHDAGTFAPFQRRAKLCVFVFLEYRTFPIQSSPLQDLWLQSQQHAPRLGVRSFEVIPVVYCQDRSQDKAGGERGALRAAWKKAHIQTPAWLPKQDRQSGLRRFVTRFHRPWPVTGHGFQLRETERRPIVPPDRLPSRICAIHQAWRGRTDILRLAC